MPMRVLMLFWLGLAVRRGATLADRRSGLLLRVLKLLLAVFGDRLIENTGV